MADNDTKFLFSCADIIATINIMQLLAQRSLVLRKSGVNWPIQCWRAVKHQTNKVLIDHGHNVKPTSDSLSDVIYEFMLRALEELEPPH